MLTVIFLYLRGELQVLAGDSAQGQQGAECDPARALQGNS